MFVICKDNPAMVNLDHCSIIEVDGWEVHASDSLPTHNGQYRSYKLLGSYSSEENAKEAFRDIQKALCEKKDVFAMPAIP